MACICRFTTTCPVPGDTSWTLVAKIVQTLSDANGGLHPPAPGDSYNRLLAKWALLLSAC